MSRSIVMRMAASPTKRCSLCERPVAKVVACASERAPEKFYGFCRRCVAQMALVMTADDARDLTTKKGTG